MFKNSLRIACKMGTLVRLARFTMTYSDVLDVSKALWLPNPENEKELVGP